VEHSAPHVTNLFLKAATKRTQFYDLHKKRAASASSKKSHGFQNKKQKGDDFRIGRV